MKFHNTIKNRLHFTEADKSRFVNKMINLTDEQKNRLNKALKDSSNLDVRLAQELGNWQASSTWTWEQLEPYVRYVEEKVAETQKKARRDSTSIEGLRKDVDYSVVYQKDTIVIYHVMTYEASCVLASNAVEPKIHVAVPEWARNKDNEWWEKHDSEGNADGAHWCISMKRTEEHWNDYHNKEGYDFYFMFNTDPSADENFKKIAMFFKPYEKVHWSDRNKVQLPCVYNAPDNYTGFYDLPQELKEAYKESPLNRSKLDYYINNGTIVKNSDGTYDKVGKDFVPCEVFLTGNPYLSPFNKKHKDLITEGIKFKYKFNTWEGNLSIDKGYAIGITSLEGCPHTVNGEFSIYVETYSSTPQNTNLKNLIGGPKKVKSIFIDGIALKSLEGFPSEIETNIHLEKIAIKNLKGMENTIGFKNIIFRKIESLTSLSGFPTAFNSIHGKLELENLGISSFRGVKQIQAVNQILANNCGNLTTLEGFPKITDNSSNLIIHIANCPITSLNGIPKHKGITLYTYMTKIVDLEGLRVNKEYTSVELKDNEPTKFSVDDIPLGVKIGSFYGEGSASKYKEVVNKYINKDTLKAVEADDGELLGEYILELKGTLEKEGIQMSKIFFADKYLCVKFKPNNTNYWKDSYVLRITYKTHKITDVSNDTNYIHL